MDTVQTIDLLSLAQSGLRPQIAHPSKVVIVGAGIAGLVAAYELQRAGHDVTILEATQRVGGRILTIREPFSNGLHAEAGAMRLPSFHKLTHSYIEKFGLRTYPFTQANGNAFFYLNGKKYLRRDIERDLIRLDPGFAGPNEYQAVLKHWKEFTQEAARRVTADVGYWDEILVQYGDHSLYNFLRQEGWSTEAITAFALMEGLESALAISFIEILKVEIMWLNANMTQIIGGMDCLPAAFLPALQNHITFGAEMMALDYSTDTVTVHYKTRTGSCQAQGDFAIITIPYPALRFVDVIKPFSPGKQMAIRQLHYANAAKIFVQCRRRFWEEDDGIFGGATVTDLPNRLIYYPDHGRDTGQGALMAAFTFGEEANRWAALPPEERISQAVKYVAKVHPQITQEFETGFSKVWSEDKFAGGAFALFEPGQEARLHAHMVAPEGPVHFAGEYTSSKHCWIEGAVESGLRAAQEVHHRAIVENSLVHLPKSQLVYSA